MFDKVKSKFIKEQQKVLSTLSEGTVRFLIQKDLAAKSISQNSVISYYFDYFMQNYITILEYLKHDFKCDKIYDINDPKSDFSDDIDEEIKTIKEIYKTMNKGLMRSKYNPVKVRKNLEKWKIINNFIVDYPKVLDLFQFYTEDNNYKDIDIEDQRKKIEEAKILEEDFDLFIKMVSDDQHRNDRPNIS